MDKKLLDRINEAYKGKLGEEMGKVTQERIHWICDNVYGEKILDVGCSKGITSILLARQGMYVTGIDTESEQIEHAVSELKKEDISVQWKVSFICGDFLDYDFKNEKFNTIVMEECLKHVFKPTIFLDKAKDSLKENGKLIVTVHFGKESFSNISNIDILFNFFNQINNYFDIDSVYYLENWTGFVAYKNQNLKNSKDVFKNSIEKSLEEEISFLKNEIEELKQYNAVLKTESTYIAELKKKIDKITKARKKLSEEKDLYNTLLYKAKRKNMRYEKLLEVKLYNFLRGIKNKDSKYELEDAYEKIENIRQKNMGEKRKAYEKLIETADSIPDSNGSRYFKQSDVRIGMIADEFQLETYRDVAEVIYLSPQNYKADIDILFIVSTWHGIKDDWTGLGKPNEEGGVKDDLMNIINYHRNKGKKICFYSKEDPSNYNVFLYIAKECDYIFTTDCDCIEKYIEDTGNANVFLLPFAINPHIHNPIGFETNMRDEVIFAGTWGMAHKYPERNIDLEILLDGVIASGKDLKIFDRNFYLNNDVYKYPVKYDEYVYPPIEHKILMKVHKLFKWGININSIKYSDSMFASRVYELQACGSLMISNWSLGMKRLFPNIFIEVFPHFVKETFDNISPKRQYELQLEGIRRVYGSETIYHRLNYILDKLGLPEFMQEMDKSVLVIVSDINNDSNIKNFERQSYNNKIMVNIDELTKDIFESADMFTYFDENSYYGEFYLEDMINGFKYTDSDFITKDAYYHGKKLIDGVRHDYINKKPNLNRTVFWNKGYSYELIKSGEIKKDTAIGYSIDHANYNIKFIKNKCEKI